jgi:hypothetical protein
VIDPHAYAAWDPLLDKFDWLRANMPVARIEAPDDSHDPFWLLTRFDDAMKVSKANATFLNHPRASVFGLKSSEALVRRSPAAARIWSDRWCRSMRPSTPSCAG